MGLLKSYATQLDSLQFAPGEAGEEARAKVKRRAHRAEEQIREALRMSFVSEREFNEWALTTLRRRMSGCVACPLKQHRSQIAWGHGCEQPLVQFVGCSPTEKGDAQGRAFAGPELALLKGICDRIGLDLASTAWLTNSVLCRPPGRLPRAGEREACARRLAEETHHLKPHLLVLMGPGAIQWLTDAARDASVKEWRGLIPKENWPEEMGREGKWNLRGVFVTYHPQWVLKQKTKAAKSKALKILSDDLRKVQKVVAKLETKVERDL